MKCKFCGTEINETDKYCPFCGTATKNDELFNEQKRSAYSNPESNNSAASNASSNTETESSFNSAKNSDLGAESKKSMHPALKIFIVFLCSLLVSGIGLGVSLLFADDILVGLYEAYKEVREEFIEALEESFGEDFRNDFEDGSGYDSDNFFYGGYDHSDDFRPGAINLNDNSYNSIFAELSFTLPEEWLIYSKSDIGKLYEKDDVPSGKVKNHLVVYDFYAKNKSNDSIFYINFFNCDYYSEYDNIEEFNKLLKYSIRDYSVIGETVQFAEDSKMTLNGIKYEQIAAMITERNGDKHYEYNFTREVNGYYMQITILSDDLNEIGEIIDLMNS